eukprot:TRINITY_DN58048_c0_g1_i1.p1 TRINITY_DN58048_c0_g1~~TRINITY_DN58048_c0_g1_i1.p1  ORF type:complete len:1205 (+),score=370.17 TRINITY_DN58048_c0_g1_i1:99-3713(+)
MEKFSYAASQNQWSFQDRIPCHAASPRRAARGGEDLGSGRFSWKQPGSGAKDAEPRRRWQRGFAAAIAWQASAWLLVLLSAILVGLVLQKAMMRTEGEAFAAEGFQLFRTQELDDKIPKPRKLEEKPKADKRTYLYVELPNGLAALSIHEAKAKKAAFSVAVDAGSFDSPPELPGLAHFCEHMLFLGTKSYPDPSGFDKFTGENGGSNNAFTADEHTVYYASVSPKSLEEGLDRFADFLRAPLFTKEYIEKEIQAIDSEHLKNLRDSDRRGFETFAALANPASPMPRFRTGNTETLQTEPKKKGLNPVAELRKWLKAQYCPSRYKVVTFGPQSAEEQLEMVQAKFGNLSRGSSECQKPRKSWEDPPVWPSSSLGWWMAMEGVQPQAELWLLFPMPRTIEFYKAAPLSYINHILTDEGEQGLSNFLKDQLGLITQLETSGSSSSAGYDYYVTFKLTEDGLEHWQRVIDVFFYFVGKAVAAGVDRELYASLGDIAQLEWDWSEPSKAMETVKSFSEQLFTLPFEHLLAGGSLLMEPDAEVVMKFMKRLRPDHMNLAIIAEDANSTYFKNRTIHKLPHYPVRYVKEPVDKILPGAKDRWSSWTACGQGNESKASGDALREKLQAAKLLKGHVQFPQLPGPIQNVPKKLSTEHMTAERSEKNRTGKLIEKMYGKAPQKLQVESLAPALAGNNGSVWYRSGWISKSAKVKMALEFVAPRKADSFETPAQGSLQFSIYGNLLGDILEPKLHDFTLAGVSYDLDILPHSLTFKFEGFMPSMPQLINRVLEALSRGTDDASEERYQRVVDEMKSNLETYDEDASTFAVDDRNTLVMQGKHSREEQQAALANCSQKAVAETLRTKLLPKPMRLSALLMGNLAEKEAEDAVSQVLEKASSWEGAKVQPKDGEEVRLLAPLVKPSAPVEVRKKNAKPGDGNDVVVLSFLVDIATVKNRVLYGLLSKILETVSYTELRTQKQLGYVVTAAIAPLVNVQYVSCLVQGDKEDADAMEAAVERMFMHDMPTYLANMSSEDFKSQVSAFKESLIAPPQEMKDEFDFFEGPITEGGECIGLQDELLAYITSGEVTQERLQKAWNDLLFLEEGFRQKLVVKYFKKKVPPRPSKEEAQALWKKQGVPNKGFALLEREYDKTSIFDKADSSVRGELRANGTTYPTDIYCSLDAEASQADPPPKTKKKTKEGKPLPPVENGGTAK